MAGAVVAAGGAAGWLVARTEPAVVGGACCASPQAKAVKNTTFSRAALFQNGLRVT